MSAAPFQGIIIIDSSITRLPVNKSAQAVAQPAVSTSRFYWRKLTDKFVKLCFIVDGLLAGLGIKWYSGTKVERVATLAVKFALVCILLWLIFGQVRGRYSDNKTHGDTSHHHTDDTLTMTLCNANFLRRTGTNDVTEQVIREVFDGSGNATILEQLPDYDTRGWLWFYTMTQHDIATMLVKCKYGKTVCNADDFQPVFTSQGLCFSFTLNQNSTQIDVSENEELSVWLSAQQEEYVYQLAGDVSAGFKVYLHAAGKAVTFDDSLSVSAGVGYSTTVTVKPRMVNSTAAFCKEKPPALHYSMQAYSQSVCHLEYLAEFLAEKCSCRWFFMSFPDVPICNPKLMKHCLLPQSALFPSIEELRDSCPPLCQELRYITHVQTTPINLSVFKSLGSYWSYTNHYNTPDNESRLWSQAMGLPEEEFFYWRDNLVILKVRVESSVQMPPESQEQVNCCYNSLDLFSRIAGIIVFFAGLTLTDCVRVLILVISKIVIFILAHTKDCKELPVKAQV